MGIGEGGLCWKNWTLFHMTFYVPVGYTRLFYITLPGLHSGRISIEAECHLNLCSFCHKLVVKAHHKASPDLKDGVVG